MPNAEINAAKKSLRNKLLVSGGSQIPPSSCARSRCSLQQGMDTANLISLVEHLEDNIDELEENLEPLLSAALTATTKKLPLLDKAKLYVLIVYSIESLLFCESSIRPSRQSTNQSQHTYDSTALKRKITRFSKN